MNETPLAKTTKDMMGQLKQLYLARHPNWLQREEEGTLGMLIKEFALRELYAIEIEGFGSLEEALKKNV